MIKRNKLILAFMLAGFMIVMCAACSTNEADTSTNTTVNMDNPVDNKEEWEQTPDNDNVELNHTYTTKFSEVNAVAYPSFIFYYPDGWTIISEEVTAVSELVELTNDTGLIMRYQYIVPSHAYGNMIIAMEEDISKIADASFIPGYAQNTDYSELGAFVVAKIITTSAQNLRTEPEATQLDSDYYTYAVMPASECGSRSTDGNFACAFEYDGLLQFMAEVPRVLMPEEEQEIIAILASFQAEYSEDVATAAEQDHIASEEEAIYAALQNGDFSYFAGRYEPCGVYHDWYGGGEQLPDLLLQDNGIITGGLVYGSYPATKPTSVGMNEDGSFFCQVRYSNNANQDYFVIYPEGVIGENPYIYNDPFLTTTPYIHYISVDGGVSDIIYYKVEE